MPKRTISTKAFGKHIGHAVEGHSRGLVTSIADERGWTLTRKLPFRFPIETDLVVLDESGKIQALVIVAYTSDSGGTAAKLDHSSHKFYRTRIEYTEMARAYKQHRASFADSFCPLVLIYGSTSSWKPQLLEDFRQLCPPVLYVPKLLGEKSTERLIERVFETYRLRWEAGKKDATSHVERIYSERDVLDAESEKLREHILRALRSGRNQKQFRASKPTLLGAAVKGVRLAPFKCRLRQGLSIAAMFTKDERDRYRSVLSGDLVADTDAVLIRKCCILGVAKVVAKKSIGRTLLKLQPRRPFDEYGCYTPDRPDFTDWLRIPHLVTETLLQKHVKLPVTGPSFRAGAWDLAAGNSEEFCRIVANEVPLIIKAATQRAKDKVASVLINGNTLSVRADHPCVGIEGFKLAWSLVVAALATANEDRTIFRKWGFRQERPKKDLAQRLAAELIKTPAAIGLLKELVRKDSILRAESIAAITEGVVPSLLNLDVPTSWSAAVYLAATTNPSHNPLGHLLTEYLSSSTGPRWIKGFPDARGVPLTEVFPKSKSRIEWMTIAGADDRIICAEVRSITQNNMGNKSKEIFDRNAQTRQAAADSRRKVELWGILDGDFDEAALEELVGGIGYDKVLPAVFIAGCEP